MVKIKLVYLLTQQKIYEINLPVHFSLSLTRFLSRNVVRTTLEDMYNILFPRKSRKLSIHVEITDL